MTQNPRNMKKLLLIIAISTMTLTAWSQSQITTVRGKTKEGKTIKVEYYKGNAEDYIESVKYQLVDELQAKVTELQSKLDAANKQVKDLRAQNQGGAKENQLNELYGQIDVLNTNIRNLNRQLTEQRIAYDSLITINQGLQQQIAQNESNSGNKPVVVAPTENDRELKRLRDSIVSKDATIQELKLTAVELTRQIDNLEKNLTQLASGKPLAPAKTPVVGVEIGLGPVLTRGEQEEGWAKNTHWAKKVDVYFGTARLTEGFPLSVEAGLGIRSFKLSAAKNACTVTENSTDADGESFQAIYTYSDRTEQLSLTYFDIPVRLCFGQPSKNRVGVYAKVGLTPSIKISGKFNGTGTYSLKGYYPQWDVTLENINELGFGNDMDCYADYEPELSTFILWGNLALGAYVPFGDAPVLLNAGLGVDFPFMSLGEFKAGAKAVIPSLELGIVYTLK